MTLESTACGHHTTRPSTETVEEGFRRKDQEKNRR